MGRSSQQVSFSKSLLAGFFTGIVVAVINLIYMIIYRRITDFMRFNIIMPLSIFWFFPVFLAVIGAGYYLMARHLPKGSIFFSALFIVLTILSVIVMIDDQQHSTSESPMYGVYGLVMGMEIITGLSGALLIPYLANHPDIYL